MAFFLILKLDYLSLKSSLNMSLRKWCLLRHAERNPWLPCDRETLWETATTRHRHTEIQWKKKILTYSHAYLKSLQPKCGWDVVRQESATVPCAANCPRRSAKLQVKCVARQEPAPQEPTEYPIDHVLPPEQDR